MFDDNWREEFNRRVREVSSGLHPPNELEKPSVGTGQTDLVEVSQAEHVDTITLRRVQKSEKDLTRYVKLAGNVLEGTFEWDGYRVKVATDVGGRPAPVPINRQGRLSLSEAASRISHQSDVLGIITDMPLQDGVAGRGSTAGRFVVTVEGPRSRKSFQNTVVHEYGHVLDLKHCSNPQCIMARSERRNGPTRQFCDNCSAKLRRKTGG